MTKLTDYANNEIIELTNKTFNANYIDKILNRGKATIERFWRKNGLHSKFNDIYCVVENHKDEIIKLNEFIDEHIPNYKQSIKQSVKYLNRKE